MTARDELVLQPPTPDEEFSRVDLDRWRAAAESGLGGGLEPLAVEIGGGVVARPLYTAADAPEPSGYPGVAPFHRGCSAIRAAIEGWQPSLRCDHPNPTAAADWISDAAGRGVNSAWLVFDVAARLGLDADRTAALERPADGMVVASISDLRPPLAAAAAGSSAIHVDGGGNGIVLAAAVIAAHRAAGGQRQELTGSLGWDPLAALAADGELPYGLDRSLELLSDAAAWANRLPGRPSAITVSTLPYASAGATAVDELACAAATGVEYLRRVVAAELDLAVVCRQLEFRISIGLDVFGEIAKLRALRRIWSCVIASCGGDESLQRAPIHAVSSPRWLTRRDPWVNMLRGTTAAFAAVAGGADRVTVLPFDAAIGPSDDFGRRIAANAHTILRDESHLGKILDPGGGSYLIERLTDDLADAAWARFKDIERAGGMAAVLAGGGLATELADAAHRRAAEIAARRRPITGVSWFADLAESPVERPAVDRRDVVAATAPARHARADRLLDEVERAAVAGRGDGSVLDAAVVALEAGVTLGEVAAAIRAGGHATTVEPLAAHRDSEPFESLRDASDALMGRTGVRPTAFLVGVGTTSGQRSCLDLARGMLASGGIEAVGGSSAADANGAAAAFAGSGAKIACICVADGHEPDQLPSLAAALRAAGARSVAAVVARGTSAPGCRKAGVDHALREGDDIVGVLASLLSACGGVDG